MRHHFFFVQNVQIIHFENELQLIRVLYNNKMFQNMNMSKTPTKSTTV